jgi:tetratricopeptide (TPR) repeat protein
MKQKVAEVTDLATFICAMVKINQFKYKDAAKILGTISKRSAEAYFYHGLALLELGERPSENTEDDKEEWSYFKDALVCFLKACREKQNFAYAWLYAGIVSYKLKRYQQGKEYVRRALEETEKAPVEGAGEDAYLLPRALFTSVMTLLDRSEELRRKITQSVNSVRDYLDEVDKLFEESDRGYEKIAAGAYKWAEKNLERGAYQEAIKGFNRAAVFNPWWNSQAKFHYNFARAYTRLGDRMNALGHLSTAAKQDARLVKDSAPNESDFEPLHTDEMFRELLQSL